MAPSSHGDGGFEQYGGQLPIVHALVHLARFRAATSTYRFGRIATLESGGTAFESIRRYTARW